MLKRLLATISAMFAAPQTSWHATELPSEPTQFPSDRAAASGALSNTPQDEDRSTPLRNARSAVDERMRAVFDD
jgi:hypothetical protein